MKRLGQWSTFDCRQRTRGSGPFGLHPSSALRLSLETLESRLVLAGATAGSGFFEDSGQRLDQSVGMAVAIGHLDGDGELDAFVVGRGGNRVFLGDGNGRFVSNRQSLGNAASIDVALADLNGDGSLDAFVANEGPNEVWINDGSGLFSRLVQATSDNADSFGVALADLDGDSDIDAFVANAGDDAANRVWRNDGSGQFTLTSDLLGSSDSHGVALADVDGNGSLDAFVANTSQFGGSASDRVWLNDGSGGFSDSGQQLGAQASLDVAFGDVDGDDDMDALVVGSETSLWKNDGSGTFELDDAQNIQEPEGTLSRGVKLADLDGDFDLDAVVVNTSGLEGAPNRVWLNTSGTFVATGQDLGNEFSFDVALGDFNGDNANDLFVANELLFLADTVPRPNRIWLNDRTPSVSFTQTSQLLGFSDSEAIAFGDLDDDGDMDAFVAVEGDGNQVWRNTNGVFFDTGQHLGSADSRSVALGDFNGDGLLDAFVANSSPRGNRVWINQGEFVFEDSGVPVGASRSWDVALGDLDGDGDLDAFTASAGFQANEVLENIGNGAFRLVASLGNRNSRAVALADLDSDGDLDAFVANTNSQANQVYRNEGNFQFVLNGQTLGTRSSWDVVLDDFNQDGHPDAFVANVNGDSDAVWFNNGAGMFSDVEVNDSIAESHALVAGDWDADGDVDIATAGSTLRILRNVGGQFTTNDQPLETGIFRGLAAADVDQNGTLDLWNARHETTDRLLLNLAQVPLMADAFEPNEEATEAATIDSVPFSLPEQLRVVIENLSIDVGGDQDFFSWTAPEDGLLVVDILFEHDEGDLDADLFDSSFLQIDNSNSETDNEQLRFNVQAGQTYFIKVFGRSANVTNRAYELHLAGSRYPADRFEIGEGNDDLDSAFDLGSAAQTLTDLSIHNADNDDWFKLTPNNEGNLEVEIAFDNSQVDLDLHLFDEFLTPLDESETLAGTESVSIFANADTPYFIKVDSIDGGTIANYQMTVIATNSLPTISEIGDHVANEDTIVGPIAFSIGDGPGETAVDDLLVSATSSDQAIVADSNIAINGVGFSRSLMITPNAHQSGVVTITVEVDDRTGGVVAEPFQLTLNAENDTPTISAISDQAIDQDTSTAPISITVSDVETPPGALILTASSSDPELVPQNGVVFGGSGPDRTVTVTPAAGQSGSATITITVNDGQSTALEQFELTVDDSTQVTIIPVTPSERIQSVDEIQVVFSEPVTGFDLADFELIRHVDDPTVVSLATATLETTDNVTWTLGNLSDLTSQSGFYELTLLASGSGVVLGQSDNLVQDAMTSWSHGAGDVTSNGFDAIGDGKFDQLDLIRLLREGMYLTRQPATWSQGDWNNDGFFDQRDLIIVLKLGHYLQGPFASTAPASTSSVLVGLDAEIDESPSPDSETDD